jgi:ATP-dependent Clp protease ATP-binding subunit ClpA
MWQRFTERAIKIFVFAQEEAAKLAEIYVGPEHLLLAVLRDRDSAAVGILSVLEIDPGRLDRDLRGRLPRGTNTEDKDMALTPSAKRVVDDAYNESRRLNNTFVGSEHLLLALARSPSVVVQSVLAAHGADLDRIRDVVSRLQAVPPNQKEVGERFSWLPFRDLYRVLSAAEALAATDEKPLTTPEHLFIALLRPGTAAVQVILATGVDVTELRRRLEPRGWQQPQNPGTDAPLDAQARGVLARMFAQFASSTDRHIDSRHLLRALVDEEAIKAILSREEINLERLRELLDKGED